MPMQGGNRNAGAGCSEKTRIIERTITKKSVFTVCVFFLKFQNKKGVFFGNFPPEALLPPSGGCWEIIIVSPESIVNSQESKGLLRDSWTKREVSRTNCRTQS